MKSHQIIPITDSEQSASVAEYNQDKTKNLDKMPLLLRNLATGWPLLQITFFSPEISDPTASVPYGPVLGGGKCHDINLPLLFFAFMLDKIPGKKTAEPNPFIAENIDPMLYGYNFDHKDWKIKIHEAQGAYGAHAEIELPIVGAGDALLQSLNKILKLALKPNEYLPIFGGYKASKTITGSAIKQKLNDDKAIFINGQVFVDFKSIVDEMKNEDVEEFFKGMFKVDEFLELRTASKLQSRQLNQNELKTDNSQGDSKADAPSIINNSKVSNKADPDMPLPDFSTMEFDDQFLKNFNTDKSPAIDSTSGNINYIPNENKADVSNNNDVNQKIVAEEKTAYTNLPKINSQPLLEKGITYFQPDGTPRSNPNYELDNGIEPFDYLVRHDATKTSAAEFWGPRKTNEDRTLIGFSPWMTALSIEDRKKVLTQTINALQQQIQELNLEAGATLCGVFIENNSITTVNVGDSEAFVVTRDKAKENVKIERLNKVLHHITHDNLDELKAQGMNVCDLGRYGCRILTKDLNRNLNMYRSMGDLDLDEAGLSHKPDIYQDEIQIPKDGEAFVLLGCDGMTEMLTQDQIRRIISEYPEIELADLPKFIAQQAQLYGSGDNISVLITPIELNSLCKFMIVFDGHGGTQVANFLKNNFMSMLEHFCKLHFDANKIPYPTERQNHVTLINSIMQLISGRPAYKKIAEQAKSLLEEKSSAINADEINKILLGLYIQDYQNSRQTSWLYQTKFSTDISNFVEKYMLQSHPEVNHVELGSGIKNTLPNRILWFAGEHYPELIIPIRDDLNHLQLLGYKTKEQREYFLNTGKVLGRLGPEGYELSSYYFKGAGNQYVTDNDITNYFDKKANLHNKPK